MIRWVLIVITQSATTLLIIFLLDREYFEVALTKAYTWTVDETFLARLVGKEGRKMIH